MSGPILGMDPGATGAMALLDPRTWTIEVLDTPNRSIQVNGKPRTEVDVALMSRFITGSKPDLIVSEKLWSRPGQDSKSTFSLGRYYGQIEACAAALGISHLTPTPQEWKKRLMVSENKDLSRSRASALIPSIAHLLNRKKDHNRAEAALLALFGCFWRGIVPEKLTCARAA